MEMTTAEIVMEYRQAKNRVKQIQILADENVCKPREIVAILAEAGCEIPKQYLPKAAKEKPDAPAEPVNLIPAKLAEPSQAVQTQLKIKAFDAIVDMLPSLSQDEMSIYSLIDRIYGMVALIKEADK